MSPAQSLITTQPAVVRHTELVRLLSEDGASIEIRPVAYQFDANAHAEPGTDWDANGLVVRGDFRTADGLEWTFIDPCLTTWDARQVTAWLRGIVDGVIQPTTEWSDEWPDEPHFRHFTEPNIAFSLQERTEARARIRIHLSLEALPPRRGHDQPDIFAYFLIMDASIEAIAAAADDWNDDCRAFPVR